MLTNILIFPYISDTTELPTIVVKSILFSDIVYVCSLKDIRHMVLI